MPDYQEDQGGPPGGRVDPPDNAADLLRGIGNRMQEKPTANVHIDKFDANSDDFEEWVLLFETAVQLATNVTSQGTLYGLYKKWLPLKIDESARQSLAQADQTANWPDLKAQLANLLIDPQERYKWQIRQSTVKWDGKESVHQLATRVVRLVNKYERDMPDVYKRREYFNRFRDAFDSVTRNKIDMHLPEGTRTIENAKDVVMRHHLASADDGKEGGAKAEFKAAGFSEPYPQHGLHPDRATSLETAIAGLTTQMENFTMAFKTNEDRWKLMEERWRASDERWKTTEERMQRMESSINRRPPYQQNSGNYQRSGNQQYPRSPQRNQGRYPQNQGQNNQRQSNNNGGQNQQSNHQSNRSAGANQQSGQRNSQGNRSSNQNGRQGNRSVSFNNAIMTEDEDSQHEENADFDPEQDEASGGNDGYDEWGGN